MDTLLNNVRNAAKEGMRTSTNDALFDLDEKGRTEALFESEASKTTLYFGKSPDYSKCFVRTEPGGPILEVDKGLDTDAGVRTEGDKRILDPAYFYDLSLKLATSADDIIDIAIKKERMASANHLPHRKSQPKKDLRSLAAFVFGPKALWVFLIARIPREPRFVRWRCLRLLSRSPYLPRDTHTGWRDQD